MLTYTILPLSSGAVPTYDPEALADELVSSCGSSYGLSTAGCYLTLFPDRDANDQQIVQVIEQHLSTDAAARRAQRARAVEIRQRLDQIDAESVRPLRAHIAGSATSADDDKLKTLDAEAADLRKELAALK